MNSRTPKFNLSIYTDPLIQAFCSAFGEQDAIGREIEAFWEGGGSPFPQAVYAHLVENRIAAKQISDEHGKFLIDYFNESFAPERTTGYLSKHREPLVAAFAEAYAKGGRRPIFRVEADIANLGGLNRYLAGTPGIKSHEADHVIGVMASILKKHISGIGKVSAIRCGGDELCLYVSPSASTEYASDAIQNAISAAHEEIAHFITDAHLTDVNHEKVGKDAGVGLGAAAIRITGQSKLQQHKILQAAIPEAKKSCLEMLGSATHNPPIVKPNAEHVHDALGMQHWHSYIPDTPAHPRTSAERATHYAPDPELDRLEFLLHKLGINHTDALYPLVKATRDLTAKRDPATGLLLFKDTEAEILPNFMMMQPEGLSRATLVHFDFNNIGGGNELGYWVGNAMRHTFTTCIKEALESYGLKEYTPYLTSQDGGKFALLLPAHISPREINRLSTRIEMRLADHARDPIILHEEEMGESLKLMAEKKDYTNVISGMSEGNFCINDIISVKQPTYQGAHVMVASSIFDTSEHPTLGKLMHTLEDKVAKLHGNKDNLIHQRAGFPKYLDKTLVDNRSSWLAKTKSTQIGNNPQPTR